MRQTLFRQQVMDEKRNRNTGQTLMRPPVSLRVMIGLCVSMFFVASIFLFDGQYSRRERSTGILVPSQGAVRVLTKGAGTVTSIHVQDGEQVEQNTPLFTLSNDKTLGSGEAAHQSTLQSLEGLADNLKARLESLPQRKAQDSADLKAEGKELAHQLEMLRNQKIISQNRLAIQKDRRQRANALADERLISKNDFQQLSDAVLQTQSHQHEAEHAILAAEAQQRTLESKKLNLDNTYLRKRAHLPIFLQTELAECGLACLAMISVFHGHDVNIQGLRRRFHPSSRGVMVAPILQKSEELFLGLYGQAVELIEEKNSPIGQANGAQGIFGSACECALQS